MLLNTGVDVDDDDDVAAVASMAFSSAIDITAAHSPTTATATLRLLLLTFRPVLPLHPLTPNTRAHCFLSNHPSVTAAKEEGQLWSRRVIYT